MEPNPNSIPFKRFFIFAEAVHLTFALPALSIVSLLQPQKPKAVIILFIVFLLGSFIGSWLTWMMAKGSNWVNTAAAMKAVGAGAGQIYGALVGGLAGWHFFEMAGGILMLVSFFVLGKLAGIALGGFAAKRLVTSRLKSDDPVAG